MDYGWLNAGSVLFGLMGLVMPVVAMIRKARPAGVCLCILVSMSFCLLAVLFQLGYGNHLVTAGDWSALMDTSEATVSLAAELALFTVLLNLAAFLTVRGK